MSILGRQGSKGASTGVLWVDTHLGSLSSGERALVTQLALVPATRLPHHKLLPAATLPQLPVTTGGPDGCTGPPYPTATTVVYVLWILSEAKTGQKM